MRNEKNVNKYIVQQSKLWNCRARRKNWNELPEEPYTTPTETCINKLERCIQTQ